VIILLCVVDASGSWRPADLNLLLFPFFSFDFSDFLDFSNLRFSFLQPRLVLLLLPLLLLLLLLLLIPTMSSSSPSHPDDLPLSGLSFTATATSSSSTTTTNPNTTTAAAPTTTTAPTTTAAAAAQKVFGLFALPFLRLTHFLPFSFH